MKMKNMIIVCPFDETLITKLQGQAMVVRTSYSHSTNADDEKDKNKAIPYINDFVNRDNKLHSILLEVKGSLSTVDFQEDWQGIPITIYADELGSFKEFAGKLSLLRQLKIRVFLTTDLIQNYTSLQILASLGIHCGVLFGEKPIDWEKMTDLMFYAIYSKAKHATIEPFHYVVSHYRPNELTDFSSVYFDNFRRYLHVNKNKQIALTHKELLGGDFIARELVPPGTISQQEKYKAHEGKWQSFFLQAGGCAYCPAWRICQGKFSSTYEQNGGCGNFFSELMDAADFYSQQQKLKDKIPCEL